MIGRREDEKLRAHGAATCVKLCDWTGLTFGDDADAPGLAAPPGAAGWDFASTTAGSVDTAAAASPWGAAKRKGAGNGSSSMPSQPSQAYSTPGGGSGSGGGARMAGKSPPPPAHNVSRAPDARVYDQFGEALSQELQAKGRQQLANYPVRSCDAHQVASLFRRHLPASSSRHGDAIRDHIARLIESRGGLTGEQLVQMVLSVEGHGARLQDQEAFKRLFGKEACEVDDIVSQYGTSDLRWSRNPSDAMRTALLKVASEDPAGPTEPDWFEKLQASGVNPTEAWLMSGGGPRFAHEHAAPATSALFRSREGARVWLENALSDLDVVR